MAEKRLRRSVKEELMNFQLLDSGWDRVLDAALKADHSQIRIVCPFIKERAAARFLRHGKPRSFQVITRFNLDCFDQGVSDVAALRYLMENGAQIRGIKNLHAKAYLIGKNRAIVTSANLTEQALVRNHEFGFDAEYPDIAADCHAYFDRLWGLAGMDLVLARIEEWEEKIAAAKSAAGPARRRPSLGDEGTDVGFSRDSGEAPTLTNSSEHGFVKFFGKSSGRENRSLSIIEELRITGAHWACTYPMGRRPRSVRNGAVMFIGQLVKNDADIMIFGRGIGRQYRDGEDDASPADIKLRGWKKSWPHYIRVEGAEFIDGRLDDGVSLNQMMSELGALSFASTKRRKLAGENPNPRTAYMQKPAMELTPESMAWLNDRLQLQFSRVGKLRARTMRQLDWPVV